MKATQQPSIWFELPRHKKSTGVRTHPCGTPVDAFLRAGLVAAKVPCDHPGNGFWDVEEPQHESQREDKTRIQKEVRREEPFY